MENNPSELNQDTTSHHETVEKDNREPYSPPQIIHELELEVRTGSPIIEDLPWDLPDP